MGGATMSRTFEGVAAINLIRCLKWHPTGIEEWSVADWALAMGGEAGEVLNAVKKLKRLESGIRQAKGPHTVTESIYQIKKEIGDVYLYLDLLAQRIGADMEDCVVLAFNETSVKEGFEERL